MDSKKLHPGFMKLINDCNYNDSSERRKVNSRQ